MPQITIQKIQEPCIGSDTSHFQWFSQPESAGFLSQLKDLEGSVLFLPVTHFSGFCQKNNIFMIRIKTQKVLENWGNIF